MDTRMQAVVNSLADQRNQGLNGCAEMAGEIAVLKEQLTAVQKALADASTENAQLKDAIEKLAPKINPQPNTEKE